MFFTTAQDIASCPDLDKKRGQFLDISLQGLAKLPCQDAHRFAGRVVRGRSSDGRALQSHCRGQEFDPPRLHQLNQRLNANPKFL
jgi:hypothetical protein